MGPTTELFLVHEWAKFLKAAMKVCSKLVIELGNIFSIYLSHFYWFWWKFFPLWESFRLSCLL